MQTQAYVSTDTLQAAAEFVLQPPSPSVESKHPPPFWHGWLSHSSMSVSQASASHPATQSHSQT